MVNWLNVTLIILIPIYGLIQSIWVPLHLKTAIWAVLYYFATGLGVTAGYHRLWAHTSYSATLPLRIFLAATAAGAVEGSCRWWSRDHREKRSIDFHTLLLTFLKGHTIVTPTLTLTHIASAKV